MIAWLKVIGMGLVMFPVRLSALVVVPFLNDEARVNHPVYGVRDATDLSYYNIGFRNACHNLFTRPMPEFTTTGNTEDETLEKLEGFQWRYRKSLDGKYVSFRITWGKPDGKKGKDEFYVGWTMNEKDYMGLTFFQLRPAWIALIPIAALYLLFTFVV